MKMSKRERIPKPSKPTLSVVPVQLDLIDYIDSLVRAEREAAKRAA